MNDWCEGLSDAAKAVCGAWFGMMSPGKGDLTFQLIEGRPSDEASAALAELVEAGVISVEPLNDRGGLVYRPRISCRWAFLWLNANMSNPAMKIPLTTALANVCEGRDYQRSVLALRATARMTGDEG